MDIGNLLGEFLRARRMVTTPRQVGLANSGPRRTPGLRREEVAMLADVSTVYYIRLEQGRERRPSDQVIVALARALYLDADATDYLYKLVHPGIRQPTPVGWPEQVNPNLERIMRSWKNTPAYVLGRRLDVLAVNPLADALYQDLGCRGNGLRSIFLWPEAQDFYTDWERAARTETAYLRCAMGANPDDPVLHRFVEELSDRSEEFCKLWARYDVTRANLNRSFRHPEVGELNLTTQVLIVNGALGQQLFVLTAAPESPSTQALATLSRIVERGIDPDSRRQPAGEPCQRNPPPARSWL